MTSPGELPGDALRGIGQAGSVECGALVRVELSLDQGAVRDASFTVYGCPATQACAEGLVELVQGRSLLEAASLSEREVLRTVPASAGREESAALAIDALHGALGRLLMTESPLVPDGTPTDPGAALVGMSGGVDSSVAALLLRENGLRVSGITLVLWKEAGGGGESSCCSPEAVRRARRVAHSLGLPHLTLDLSATFYQEVVSYFLDCYRRGLTPNPCAKCNARVRFGTMLSLVEKLRFGWLATGHYARMLGEPRGLARGIDPVKDQSYVLAEVQPDVLSRVLFPLGEKTKTEVRSLAARFGLEGHELPESQEICFVADDDYRRFLHDRLGEMPGPIVDAAGNRLGYHRGIYNFTIGQRRGLRLARPQPLYVLELRPEASEVVVGGAEELLVSEVVVDDMTWHREPPSGEVEVQVRSSGRPLSARLLGPDARGGPARSADDPCGSTVTLLLDPPSPAVAPGQTAVVYEGDRVVAAGTIVGTTASGGGAAPGGGREGAMV